MAQEALDEITLIVTKVQDLIVWGKSKPMWSITSLKLKESLDLWAKGQLAPELVDQTRLLSAEEWKRVAGVSRLLDKLHTARSAVSWHINLRLSLKQEFSDSCSFISGITAKLLQKLERYWENMFLVMAVAAVMDPRCKMVYIEYLCSKDETDNGESQQSTVLGTVRSLYDSYAASSLQQHISYPSDSEFISPDSDEEEDFPNKKMKLAEYVGEGSSYGVNNIVSHLQDYQNFVKATSRPLRSELDWYLEEPVLAWDKGFNMLSWWRSERPKYPTLCKMARDLLSIPFSVVTSYDAYYTEERMVNKQLLSSRITLTNALLCSRSWHQRD